MSMQYRGWLSLGGVKVPISRSTLDKHPNPIMIRDTIIGGANSTTNPATNPQSSINYAQGANAYNGDITFHLHADQMATVLGYSIGSSAYTRGQSFVLILDNGIDNWTYNSCKVRQLTLNARGVRGTPGPGGTVECTMTIEASIPLGGGVVRTWAPHVDIGSSGYTATGSSHINSTPIPFWNTQFSMGTPVSIISAMVNEWSLTINNNTYVWYGANNQDPLDLQQGLLQASGSVTYYPFTPGQATEDVSDPFSGGFPGDGAGITVVLNSNQTLESDPQATLTIPFTVLTGYPRDITGPNDKPIRIINFEGVGSTTASAIGVSGV